MEFNVYVLLSKKNSTAVTSAISPESFVPEIVKVLFPALYAISKVLIPSVVISGTGIQAYAYRYPPPSIAATVTLLSEAVSYSVLKAGSKFTLAGDNAESVGPSIFS